MSRHGEQVSLERLRQLLDQGEAVDLDFKKTCDLNERAETVAITKDLAAFSAAGGHIVVGVGEDGTLSALFTYTMAKLFDEATLRAKVAPKYLPETISITTQLHQLDDQPVILVYVAAHPNGFVVITGNGDYRRPDGKQAQDFRVGDVFVRRGSSSVRWNPEEADAVLDRAMAARKEQWRAELRENIIELGLGQQAQDIARGPAASFTWQLDNDAFTATLIELLRAGDDIAITLALNTMARDAGDAVLNGTGADLQTILDRLASTAATAVVVHRPALLAETVAVLLRVYNLAYDPSRFPRQDLKVRAQELWLEIITRVYSVGALAVRRRDWDAVKTLTLQVGSGHDFDWYTNWLRHALTEAARANLLQTQQGGRQIELSLLQLAANHVERVAALRPDVPDGDEAILNSLAQFDVLSILTVIAAARSLEDNSFYTNFARWNWSRSEPALVELLGDPDMRQRLFPLDDQFLADAIREVSRLAHSEGFRFAVFPGWRNEKLNAFLQANPPQEPGA
jgi:hypothetical protein